MQHSLRLALQFVRIRVLGPLEIESTGQWQAVGAAKWRSLLALLVVYAGESVPVDRVVAELWPAGPPRTATNQVHGYVARLRRALDDPDGALLRTRAPGYVLDAAADLIDALRFRELADQGAAALRDGDAQQAADLLGQALSLWRGPAYADVGLTDAVRAEAARLEEERATALENRIAAELLLGAHHRLVAELQRLTEEHPFREQLWAQLMVALYRCGRQAEALAAYQRLVRRLREELGVEPSESVRRTHQQILTNDAALRDPTETESVSPRQLPTVARHFVGREHELDQLDKLADSVDGAAAVVVAAITGPPGIGKTATALRWAHGRADRFPDGQLYVNLRGFDPVQPPVTPTAALRELLDGLAVPRQRLPAEVDARAALFRTLMAGRRMLLVLDNARDAEQVRPLLPGSSQGMVVVTSRHRLTGLVADHGAHPIALDLLTDREARRLLSDHLGADRLSAEQPAVAELVEHCARLPLALTVVSARAAVSPTLSLSALAAELAAAHDRLDALDTGEEATSPRAAFASSYRAISDPARRLFRHLGLHPGPDISAAAFASLAGAGARRPLAELVAAQLVIEHVPGRFALHDLLRAYAAELARDDEEAPSALRRLHDHYLHTAFAAAGLVSPTRDPIEPSTPAAEATVEPLTTRDEALAWFATERLVLTAAVEQAAELEWDRHVWQLAWALVDCFDWQGAWQDWIANQHLALTAAERSADRAAQATSHRFLARAHTELGNFDSAYSHLWATLDLAAELGDLVAQARAHQGLNGLFSRWDRTDAALGHAERALDLFRAAGHVPGEADALNAVGWNHAVRGDYERAFRCCLQALELHEQVGKSHGEAATWDSLGFAHHHLGDYERAIDCYRRCCDLYREIGGDRFYEAVTLDHLGDTQLASGDPAAAYESWRHACRILDEHDHPYAESVVAKLEGR